ncbi:hypothetical protein R3P38DRAFT_2574875 [Favolaschia claudopus]|uniref:Zn(2)-C6 fungal-type domain-containing protein n=1 Tax=Favolaschia claudopus TaxID=2862362 RepID=A0AAV9ZMH1_9AGAR
MANTPSSLNNRRRRAMISCTNCRRRKIKCVTTEEPPRKPCQRCTKRGLVCEYVAAEDDEPDTAPESAPPPLSLHTTFPQRLPPGAHMRGHGPQYPPSQPTPYGQWANQPQHLSVPHNGYLTPQPRYLQPQGYPSPYGYPQQFNPPSQWAQGSHTQASSSVSGHPIDPTVYRCADCGANPCLCNGPF